MTTLLYDIALLLLSLFQLPKMLYMRIFHKKYRDSLAKKFGKGFPPITKGDRTLIWIHAVSVGETKAVAPLAKLLQTELANPFILISSGTETGHAEAQRSIPSADAHVYLPFDFSWIIKPIVKQVAPDLVILCESDFWFNFLTESKKQGAKIALINGKMSERSFQRYRKVPRFAKALFAPFDSLCIQSVHYEERFQNLGLPIEKMHVTGNIKFDDSPQALSTEQLNTWKTSLGLSKEDLILVVGSCHDPEEKLVLDAAEKLWKRFPTLRILLVPRHPERFNEVSTLLQQRGIPYRRYTELNGHPTIGVKVLLMDTMGLLRKCYQLADVAMVGGSFTERVGGHNIIEPAWYGVPVLFGPHMHSQPELLELVNDYRSGQQVPAEALESALNQLLENEAQRKNLGQAGLKLVGDMQGATRRTWQFIKNLI